MTDEEYRAHMGLLGSLAGMIAEIPLEEIRTIIDRAESVGFLFVAPIDDQRGLENTARQKRIVDAAISLKRAVEAVREEVAP